MIILVTGGDGQLGRCLKDVVNSSIPNNNEWVFLSRKELDITDMENVERVFDKYKPDYVVNCAAYTNVDKAFENHDEAEKAYIVNEFGPLNLARRCEYYNAKLIHISTDFVFDGTKNTPYEIDDETNPLSVYGNSKLSGEKRVIRNHENTFVIRTSWLYSEYGNNFFKTMYNRINGHEPTFVVNDQVGTPTYAGDLAKYIYDVVTYRGLSDRINHFSSEGCCSWYDFAKAIELLNSPGLTLGRVKIYPISTANYEKKIDKILAKRPSYSVLSNNDKLYATPHWLESLRKFFFKYKESLNKQ